MSAGDETITGGCLCGALRYEARDAPSSAGYCCCADCRKASGSGFIGFMNFAADQLRISGDARTYASLSLRGGEAARNFCPACGGLVFGGRIGIDDSHTVYAGSLDDPGRFRPTLAIFMRVKPDWVVLPTGLSEFQTMPGLD